NGLVLDSSSGTISGTPVSLGNFNFTLHVLDADNQVADQPLSIAISPVLLSISTDSFPNGDLGTPYSQTAAATGGAQPLAWSVSLGILPEGLTLDGSSGTISGTPTTEGAYNFTLHVDDSANHSADKPLSIEIGTSTQAQPPNIDATPFAN